MNKSHLLIDEPALQVLPSLAKAIGLEEAIILQQLHYWLNNPRVAGREHDGRKWIYNSYQEWQDNFPFWSVQQIQRIFLNLERGGVVIAEKLDSKKHDQTKFYTLDYDALCAMQHIKFESSSVSESNDVNKELHRLPETTGAYAPRTIEEAIFAGKPVTNDMLDQKAAEMRDAANLIEMGCPRAGSLALAFMEERGIVFPNSKVKGQRKAAREMLAQGVNAEHVREAVRELVSKGMTVTDLYSVEKTAVNLANKPQEKPSAPVKIFRADEAQEPEYYKPAGRIERHG